MSIKINGLIPGTKNFYWKEFIFCHQWWVFCFPPSHVRENIIKTAKKMDLIRQILGNQPIKVTSGWRPPVYNEMIGGAKKSAHRDGLACDFISALHKSDDVRKILEPYLEQLDIRMEKLPGASWVHIDLAPVVHERYFRP